MSLPSHMTKLGSLKPSDPVVTSVPAADWAESDSDSPSFVANKPTAMRSPAALSFGQKTYDGSAAQTLTAADLGALTSHQDISGKADKSTTYTKTQVDEIVAAVKGGSRQIVASLASVTDPQPLVIYMVAKSTSQTNNAYDEYIYITADDVGKWEKIGDTEIDLSGYARTANLATVATSGSYNDLSDKPTIPAAVTVDDALSTTSENPVQNKVVTAALNGKATSAQGVKADAALSRKEAEAGFTEWSIAWHNPNTDHTGYPDPADTEVYSYSEEGVHDWRIVEKGTPHEGQSLCVPIGWTQVATNLNFENIYAANRTRLPTMADIPTDSAQLINGAGYATTTAMNTALASKADASSLPYALVTVTPTAGAPFVLAECFPIKYEDADTSVAHTVQLTDISHITLTFDETSGKYEVFDSGFSDVYPVFLLNADGTYYSEGRDVGDVTFGASDDPAVAGTTQVLGFTPTYALTDRAINAVSLSAAATLVFPAQTAGKARDFVVRLTLTETNNAVPSVTFPADVAYETEGGEWPDLTEAGTYIVRLTEVPTVGVSETARFFLQCSSAVADATPPSAGGES